jgi:methylglutamate dehydrogenase subunit C
MNGRSADLPEPSAGATTRAFRLPAGGLIDRSRLLRARFDGREVTGFAGDTLASALLANGTRIVGRSFKYHRPRGILAAGSEEPNALVELQSGARREPNTKATTVELYDGLEAASQNRWPSLKFDLLAVNSLMSPVFVAGFYYKTFMWPASFWEKLYEPFIRRAAGLGRGAGVDDPDHYEHAYAFCDVLVIGAGPAGLAATLAAGRSGARVIICDEDFRFGGRLLAERQEVDGMAGHAWATRAVEEFASLPEVRLMPRTTVFGVYDGGTYGAIERVADHLPVPPAHHPRQRLWKIVAKRAVVAAGATERPIVFGGNDRPGIMLASAMRTYVNRFAVAPGRRVAVFTSTDDGWRTAADLAQAGIRVAVVIDSRPVPSLKAPAGTRVMRGGAVIATKGRTALRAITVRTADRTEEIAVDALAVSGGWDPVVQLTCHHGHRPVWNETIAAFVPGTLPKGLTVAGAANGTMTLAACLAEGARAGREAAEAAGSSAAAATVPKADDEPCAVTPLWHVTGSKAFVDFQNDVTYDDIALAAREGFRSVEHLKRYTTLGMATDQGKTANVNALAVMAGLTNRPIPETGTTAFRPPYTPVAIGAFAGHHRGPAFRPARLTPSHAWAEEQNAVFVETGLWLRAQYFPRAGERDWLTTVNREVTTVRSAVGFCDVSTLGKIDVQGSDAARFLDRLYVNTFSTLAVGRTRYGVMLREDGFVMDDGTTARLAEDRFIMTTTTANAARVFQHMQFCRQVLWPDLDVQFVSVTDQWAQYAVAGPRARDTLAALVDPPFDISDAAFSYMAAAELTILGGVPARLFRISFSGELGYEIAVPARFGDALARTLMEAGAGHGIAPYGTEALGVMRIEKGHAAGNEIDGRTTARDLGLGKLISAKKDYIGRTLANRPGLIHPDRPALVGCKPVDQGARLAAGAHFLPVGAPARAAHDQGVVTSVAFSPTLGHWIGLGLLARGPQRIGERVRAVDPVRDGDIVVEICAPCFVDPAGERLRPTESAHSRVSGNPGSPSGSPLTGHPIAHARDGDPSRGRADKDRVVPGHYGAIAGEPGVWLSERADPALVMVMARKGAQDALAWRVRDLYALDPPATPRRVASGPIGFVWAGPGRWLAVAEREDGYRLAARLRSELGGLASIVDQSDGLSVIRVGGAKARDTLAKGIPIDLAPRAFGPDDVALTTAGHIGVHLWQADDASTYDIAVGRSYAAAFRRWLMDAAAEFGVEVVD